MQIEKSTMDYSTKSRTELLQLCKDKNLKGYSSKKKDELIEMLNATAPPPVEVAFRQDVIQGDCMDILPTLEDNSAQIILADPPYNIGKDFGNKSDKQPMNE